MSVAEASSSPTAGHEPPRPRVAPRALIARLGGQTFALPASTGGRVLEIETLTRVPTGPDHLVGIGNSGGTIVAVIDIRMLLGLPAARWGWPLLAQIAGPEEMKVAIALEEVVGLGALEADRLQPLAAEVPAGVRAFARGSLETRPERAILLDVPRIVETLRVEST